MFVAVTTDPERDTTEVAAAYSRELGLYDGWHFVTGDPEALREVWSAYAIDVGREPEAVEHDHHASAHAHGAPEPEVGLDDRDLTLAGSVIRSFGGGYDVSHTAAFWIVDRAGNRRVLLGAEATPQDIAKDVRFLLRG